MLTPQHKKIQIPTQLSRFVLLNGLHKAFTVYLFLKCVSHGKLHKDSEEFLNMKSIIGIKTDRSIKKYLQQLLQLNWVGYNAKSGYYFIRGIDYLRFNSKLKSRQATTFYFKHIRVVHEFLIGTILSAEVNKQKFIWEVVIKRKLRSAMNNKDVARQAVTFANTPEPEYFGLSVNKIAELLHCKKSNASFLKIKAAKAGFIKVTPKCKVLAILQEADYNLRGAVSYHPHANRIRFKKVTINRVKCVKVSLQLHDEIKPRVNFKTVSKFNNLQVSKITIEAFKRTNDIEAAA